MTAVQTHPSRRTLLRAAGGLGAGALLAGCTAQAPPTPPQVVVPPDPLGVLAVAARADAVNGALVAAGAIAPVSEPGYLMPLAVTDPVTATQLAVIVETDTAVAWRSVLERSDPSTEGVPAGSFDVRATAVAGLSDCAVRATGWRVALGTVPATTAFPGMPTPTGG